MKEEEIIEKESSIRSGGASHTLNFETVGGKLYLLANELVFKSHIFNIQKHVLRIPVDQIKEVKTFNTSWIVPNGLEIVTHDGQTEQFIVFKRSVWKQEIEKQMAMVK